jgi:hypothetical protein
VHLANLTLTQLLALAAAGGILVVVLYLENTFHRRREVSSLQFWALVANRQRKGGRRRIRDVPSLLLQLLCLAALLLAAAQPEWGWDAGKRKSHLVLLDTSSWTLRDNGQGSVLNREKALVRRYLSSLPASDEVMLTRVDGLVAPLTPFTTDRDLLQRKLADLKPSLLALNLREALSFARQAGVLSLSGGVEVVYIGPARIGEDASPDPGVPNLRAFLVDAKPSHCGISHVGLARDDQNRSRWKMRVALRNYGRDACNLLLQTNLSGAALPTMREHLDPGEDTQAEYEFAGTQRESLAITLLPEDGLSSDHHVALELPPLALTRIVVYTSRPEVIRGLVEAVPDASIRFSKQDEYRPNLADADLVILDRMPFAVSSQIPTLWIAPGSENSPFQVKTRVVAPRGVLWNLHAPPAEGLHNEDVPLPAASVYQLSDGDTPVLSVPEGPIAVVRSAKEGAPRRAVLGFDPADDKVRYAVTTPLLFINLVRWLAAQSLLPTQIAVSHAGAAEIDLADGQTLADVQVVEDRMKVVLFLDHERHVELFAAQKADVRFFHQGRKQELALTLPEIAETNWRPAGLQRAELASFGSRRLARRASWRWLVLLALAITLLEWWLFGEAHLPVGAGVPLISRHDRSEVLK